MSMQWVRERYGVPAKRGALVKVFTDKGDLIHEGAISSASNYIHVDGMRFHPTWNVVYLSDDGGEILCDTRKG